MNEQLTNSTTSLHVLNSILWNLIYSLWGMCDTMGGLVRAVTLENQQGGSGQSEDSYQTGHLPGLIGVLAVRIVIFSCCGSLGQLNNNTQQTSVTKSTRTPRTGGCAIYGTPLGTAIITCSYLPQSWERSVRTCYRLWRCTCING